MEIKKFIREWVIPIVAAIGVALLVKKYLVYNVYIPSPSMVPTLNVDDKLIVSRVYNVSNLNRGDIIVFQSDELDELLIKRLIGLPGDHIEIDNGIVTINGEKLQEDYVKNNEDINSVQTFDVPDGEYFFLGDNRANSRDSRYWKEPYIEASKIEGKAILKYYPFSDFGSVK